MACGAVWRRFVVSCLVLDPAVEPRGGAGVRGWDVSLSVGLGGGGLGMMPLRVVAFC